MVQRAVLRLSNSSRKMRFQLPVRPSGIGGGVTQFGGVPVWPLGQVAVLPVELPLLFCVVPDDLLGDDCFADCELLLAGACEGAGCVDADGCVPLGDGWGVVDVAGDCGACPDAGG